MTAVSNQQVVAQGYDSRPASNKAPERWRRVGSIDVVRGLAMVLMAIDHVRVYSGQPAGGPTPGIFFTRWVTHFVAPAFLFLAGTGAYLYGRKVSDRAILARFLVTRGVWLVLLELTVLRLAWTFNFDFAHYLLAGIIWMIGWCMVIMAAAVYLPLPAIAGDRRDDRCAAQRHRPPWWPTPTGILRARPQLVVEDSVFWRRREAWAAPGHRSSCCS